MNKKELGIIVDSLKGYKLILTKKHIKKKEEKTLVKILQK